MPTKKPRIQAIVEEDIYKKFKKLCHSEDRTESKLAGIIITKDIQQYESINGEIIIEPKE